MCQNGKISAKSDNFDTIWAITLLTSNFLIQLSCSCKRYNKIPEMELEFLYAQRNRGPKLPAIKIGSIDRSITNNVRIQAARKVKIGFQNQMLYCNLYFL